MTTSATAPRWTSTTVGLLVVAWVLAFPAVVVWLFGIGMQGWADQHSGTDRSAELQRSAAHALFTLAALISGGPALIAVVAFAGRLRRTGIVFTVLAVAGAVLAVPVAGEAFRTVEPAAPPPSAPTVCQEHSGGDTRCPGG
jgi:hypothetical protein